MKSVIPETLHWTTKFYIDVCILMFDSFYFDSCPLILPFLYLETTNIKVLFQPLLVLKFMFLIVDAEVIFGDTST